jgi:DinB superfamily
MNQITLDALEAFPAQLEAHYDAIPQEFKHWTPDSWAGIPSEAFTAIEQICHVRDIEIEGYHVRLSRTLSELNPTLASIDSERLALTRSYSTQSSRQAFAAFRLARAETVAMVRGLSPEQLNRKARFEGYGPLTLRSLMHYLCSHDHQHLAGLQWLQGKIEASRL